MRHICEPKGFINGWLNVRRAGTVEEKILELQSWKRRFINDIIDERGRLPQQISLQTDDLKFLLGRGPIPSIH